MAKRRGNQEGSITKRDDGRWMGRIMVNGQRKSVYGATRKEVQDKLDKARRDMQSGLATLDERQTVKQYLATWHETVRPRLAPTSYVHYGDYIRHLNEGLGHILDRIIPMPLKDPAALGDDNHVVCLDRGLNVCSIRVILDVGLAVQFDSILL